MIFYKLIAGVAVLICGMWFHFKREEFEKQKAEQLDSYIKLIAYIKNMIQCYMMPIDKIIASCPNDLIWGCGLTDKTNVKTLDELISESDILLHEDIIDKLYSFSQEFGTSYLNEQIKSCDKYLDELCRIHKSEHEKRIKDRKISFAICISISLSLVIILI